MKVKIEPIVPLNKGMMLNQTIDTRIAEVLMGKGRPPRLNEEWIEWTQTLIDSVHYFIGTGLLDKASINMDSDQILIPGIVDMLGALEGYPVIIEWTERGISNADNKLGWREIQAQEKKVVNQLEFLRKNYGYEIALDDVGSGECGFRRMTMIEPDLIKIDGPVFKLCGQSSRVRDVVSAHVEGYKKIAPILIEWIESENDLALATELGASYGQGYFWRYAHKTPLGSQLITVTDSGQNKDPNLLLI